MRGRNASRVKRWSSFIFVLFVPFVVFFLVYNTTKELVMSTELRARFFLWQLDHHVGQMVAMLADMKFGKRLGNQGFLRL